MGLLLSIRPHHARRIFAGLKTAEFRRVRVRHRCPSIIWIYETTPVRAVTGTVQLVGISFGDGADLCRFEEDAAERSVVRAYLDGAPHCSALHLGGPLRFDSPLALSDLGVTRAPQSYRNLGTV